MRKIYVLFLSVVCVATTAIAANLNVYASGLKIIGLTDEHQLSISYFLNAPADEVTFYLLPGGSTDASSPVLTIDLGAQSAGEHSAVIDMSNYLGAHYTWAIKAKSNTANATAQPQLASGGKSYNADGTLKHRFNFYTPNGLAVDNNPNSPYFGRIYVSESRDSVQTTSGKSTDRIVKQGIYIYGADLSDITNQGVEPYVGGVSWNKSHVDSDKNGFQDDECGPARLTVDDEGYVYICDNGPVADSTSGVWRMNPSRPSENFKDVLNTFKSGKQQIKRGTLYNRINSAVVTGTGRSKHLIAIDNKGLAGESYLVRIPLDVDELVYTVKSDTLKNLANYVPNANNTIVKGIYDDFWIFHYRNITDDKTPLTYPIIVHVNSKFEVDFTYSLRYCRRGSGAISPDGKMLAFNGVYEGNRVRLFNINYDANKKPSLVESTMYISSSGENVEGISFDVAGNLYFVGSSNEWFYAYALPKPDNSHTTIAPLKQQIRVSAPRILAYDLRLEREEDQYKFSFYVNSTPTSANLLFFEEGTEDYNTATPVGAIQLTGITKGRNEYSTATHLIPKTVDLTKDLCWALQLTGAPINQFGEVYHQDTTLSRAHAVIDNSTESDFFGRIYMSNRIEQGNGEVYVFNYDYSPIIQGELCGMSQLNSAARPAVDAEGYIYWADYGDQHSGLWVTDPHTLRSTKSFFNGTPDANGVWRNTSIPMGGSSTGAFVYSTGANTKLYMLNEDGVKVGGKTLLHPNGYCVYNIGQPDGSILREWSTAPSQIVQIKDSMAAIFSIVGTSHGAWVCQNRTLGYNSALSYSLQFYDNNGVCKFQSKDKSGIFNGSFGAGMAVSPDEKLVAMVNGNGDIQLFDIEWGANDEPLLTPQELYPTNFAAISTIHFDYAGNLVVAAGSGYASEGMLNDLRLVVFSQPTNTNSIIVPAQKKQTLHNMVTLLDYKKDNNAFISSFLNNYENVAILRSLRAGMYNTLCIPMSVSIDAFQNTPLEGADVLEFTKAIVSEGSDDTREIILEFSFVDQLQGGQPYLVKPLQDIDRLDLELRNVQITTSNDGCTSLTALTPNGQSTSHRITFQGIFSPLTLTANDKSILFLSTYNNLSWANETADMYGLRGYFSLPGVFKGVRAKASVNSQQNTTTDLPSVSATTDQQTQKILHNGVLYILRDGAIYTIMGTKMQ